MRCPLLSELPPPPPGKTGWPWTEESRQMSPTMATGQPWPKVSIITPSYNQGQFIEETIRSILLQGYPNLEYIIMDGGSKDNSVEIIRKYEPWLTSWVSERDRGQSHAVNKGFERSTGHISAWMNSDDTYEKGALSAVVNLMVKNTDIDVVYGNVKIINENSETQAEMRSVPFHTQAFLYDTVHIAAQSAVFWRNDLFKQVGMVDENIKYAMDRELLIRFIEAGAKFQFIHTILGTYRCHGESKTFGSQDESESELLKIQQIAKVKTRSDYKLWKSIYRIRQFAYLTLQGDLPYMLSRIVARILGQSAYNEMK